MMSAPLILSLNVRNLSEYDLATYGNKEVIDIDQDPAVQQALRLQGFNLTSVDCHQFRTRIATFHPYHMSFLIRTSISTHLPCMYYIGVAGRLPSGLARPRRPPRRRCRPGTGRRR